ncbi:hypothetical protein [Pseudogracilibacillus auburnensis]|nr:hypothetical protein [Pseudogracilibacillus auburnensis]MBO1005616.1 hypothetical protein [Pseudogracilibacillus auburnensis]
MNEFSLIRQLFEQGYTVQEIAEMTPHSLNTIASVIQSIQTMKSLGNS